MKGMHYLPCYIRLQGKMLSFTGENGGNRRFKSAVADGIKFHSYLATDTVRIDLYRVFD